MQKISQQIARAVLWVVPVAAAYLVFASPAFAAYISPSGPVYPGASYSVKETLTNSGSSALPVVNDWFYKVNNGGWNTWCHSASTVPAHSSLTVSCSSTGDVAGTSMEFQVNTWTPDYSGTVTWSTAGFTVQPRPVAVATASVSGSSPVSYNSGTYLTWTSNNTSSCTLTNFGSVPTSNSGTGYYTGNLTADTTFTLSCSPISGATGTPTNSFTVRVNPAPVVTYRISASAGTGGSVSCPNCGSSVKQGTSVTATASANSGYQFSSWSGGPCSGSGSSVCRFTATSNQSMTANFSQLAPSAPQITRELIYPTAATGPCETPGTITLSWTKADAAKWAGYKIYRFDKDPLIDPSVYQTITIRDINQTTYTDTTPKQNTHYWYRIETLTRSDLGVKSGSSNLAAVLLAQAGAGIQSAHTGRIPGPSGDDPGTLSSEPCPAPTVLLQVREADTPSAAFSSRPIVIDFQKKAELKWTSQNAKTCKATPGTSWSGGKTPASGGTEITSPLVPSSNLFKFFYTIECTGQ